MPKIVDGPTVTSRMLNGLEEFMTAKTLDFARHLRQVDIEPGLASDPDGFVDFKSILTLFENAAAESGDDTFGLHFAEACPLCPIGLYHYVVSNAPLLREALTVRARFSKLVVSAYDLSFEEANGVGRYTWLATEQFGPRRQFLNYVVMLLVERVRVMLADARWMPLGVSFQHATPNAIEEFRRALGGRVQFEAQQTCVLFDHNSLGRRLPAADSLLFHELQRVVASSPTAPDAGSDLLVEVRRALVGAFPRDEASIENVAHRVGHSVRGLQRELAKFDTTFEAVRDTTRKQTAHQYVVDSNLSLTEIAFLLGYSELSAFSRAAREWFGEPASQLRKRSRPSQ